MPKQRPYVIHKATQSPRFYMHSGRMSRRHFLTLGTGSIAAAVLAACAPQATTVPPTAGAVLPTDAPAQPTGAPSGITANLKSITSGYDNPNWSHHAADIVAREKGWFKEVGLENVDVIIFNDSMTAIVGGGVNLTAADTDVVIPANTDEGVDIWWLGTRRDAEDLLFGLAPGRTLESLRGSGAQVSGGNVGSRNELLGKLMLRELGLDPEKDVTWVTMSGGSDTRLAALINGNLAGSTMQIRHITQLEAAGGTVVYNKPRDIAQDGYVAMGPFIQQNPDTVTAFLTAIIRAKQWLKDSENTKDEAIAILEKNGFEFPQEFVDAYQANIDNMSADCGFEVPEMDLVWSELAQVGEAPENYDWRRGVNMEFTWKAQELNGLPRRPASL